MVNSPFFAGKMWKNVSICHEDSIIFPCQVDYFISHWWGTPFMNFCESVKRHAIHMSRAAATRADVVWLISFPSTTTIETPSFIQTWLAGSSFIVIFQLPWLIIGGLCFWVVGGLKEIWVPICWPAKAARWRCCQALMGISHWKKWNVASGHLTKSYWKWPSRNSGFTMIYPLKMVDLSIVMLVYQRVTNNHQQYGI